MDGGFDLEVVNMQGIGGTQRNRTVRFVIADLALRE